jgi:hypothetical protein
MHLTVYCSFLISSGWGGGGGCGRAQSSYVTYSHEYVNVT